MTAALGVTAAFELSWQALTEPAQRLAALLSLFALAEIAWPWVVDGWPEADAEDLEEWREQLLRLSLLERVGAGRYQLHQLLREFFALKWAQYPDREELEVVVWDGVLNAAQSSSERPDRSLLAETNLVLPHLQAAITRRETAGQDEAEALSVAWLATLYDSQGRYGEAEPLYARSLTFTNSSSALTIPMSPPASTISPNSIARKAAMPRQSRC